MAGQEAETTCDTLTALYELLDSAHPRFALILGDFGAGKTFLLHELARRMASDKHPATPVLVELRALEKAHALNPLLAQHLAKADLGRIDLRAFRYMLGEGRVALLFDGFDELALRVSYDRALEHFATLAQAAEGNAKVVVTSRTQHFLTDSEVKKELARRAEALPGYRLIKLLQFEKGQIKRFLVKRLGDEQAAAERFRLLDQVKDLLGLSQNPRMLSFIAEIPVEELQAAETREGRITSATLYALLIERWLKGEHDRANPEGAPDGLTLEQLWAGAFELAKVLWARVDRSVNVKDLPVALFMAVQAGGQRPPVDAEVARHQLGSGSLLVRDDQGMFSFLHQSVLEWLVAREAAREVEKGGASALLGTGEMSDLMADFFADLAGHQPTLRWARGVLEGEAAEAAKKNANRVLRRLGKPSFELDFAGQDLQGQDFSGQDLRGANFRGAKLWNATLSKADLSNADLSSAQLVGAELTGAVLAGANLRDTDLRFAWLLGADLRGAVVDGANLTAAKFVGAKMDRTSPAWMTLLRESGAALPEPDSIESSMISAASEWTSVALSPNGGWIAAGQENGTILLLDAAGQVIRTFRGHRSPVTSVACGPDGKTLASGSEDKTVRLWAVSTGRALCTLVGHTQGVQSVAFGPDGKTLASGSVDKTVRLWDLSSGRALCTFEGHTSRVLCVAFRPDGKTIVSSSYDMPVQLWEVSTGRALRTFEGHTYPLISVAFRPEGKTRASGSLDQTVRLWDMSSGRELRKFEGHTNVVWSVAFSPDGKTLASASTDGTIRLWDIPTGACLAILHTTPEGWVAFTPEGRYKMGGAIAGSFWHVIGLCRFEPGELDPYLPKPLRIPDDEPLFTR